MRQRRVCALAMEGAAKAPEIPPATATLRVMFGIVETGSISGAAERSLAALPVAAQLLVAHLRKAD